MREIKKNGNNPESKTKNSRWEPITNNMWVSNSFYLLKRNYNDNKIKREIKNQGVC